MLQAAIEAIDGLVKTKENLTISTKVLDRLEALVHVSRASKAPDVKVTDVEIKTTQHGNVGVVTQVTAKTGDNAQYNTRITLAPNPGFRCTCPDLEKRHKACTHVALLQWSVGNESGFCPTCCKRTSTSSGRSGTSLKLCTPPSRYSPRTSQPKLGAPCRVPSRPWSPDQPLSGWPWWGPGPR